MDRFVLMPPPPPPSPPQNSEYQHQKRQQQTPARPAKRRGRKPGLHSSAIQRNAANARERSRMRVLSTAFMELKSVLPWVPRDTKLSKLDTLKLASGYITYLKRILDDPEAQDSLSTVSPPFTDSDPLFGTMMKGSTSRMKNSHEEQLLLQKLERKKPQIQYTCVDAQVVQTCFTSYKDIGFIPVGGNCIKVNIRIHLSCPITTSTRTIGSTCKKDHDVADFIARLE
ncbi:Transcription factor [Echinococcus granulosus]|uniref:Transcription factor n=1 Tax=Echinococcus granulosus TaxID=6210 RepID=W6ULC2_ECHGR|nr:Transcription factor [Echinococcus granulosus]EUB62310.1 Transcription factor [Echinococcus granulosus]